MTELAKAKRRIRQLDKLVQDIGSILQEADDALSAHGANTDESSEYRLVRDITNRIGRTHNSRHKVTS